MERTFQRWAEAPECRFRLSPGRERSAWPDRSRKRCVNRSPATRNMSFYLSNHRQNLETGLTNAEASEVIKALRLGIEGTALAGAKSASEILYEESRKLAVFTFSRILMICSVVVLQLGR